MVEQQSKNCSIGAFPLSFRQRPNVLQDAAVDTVDYGVRPERPVILRRHLEFVPGASLEARAALLQGISRNSPRRQRR